ncbi:hypothetical protein QH494_26075 [Sphingomonas sp. AR_OL41]|uniref:hypothetical protein n=1 Tax=Sphingomonas sp. AR_OL41 TaxID=3042729 RepID=UPI0024815768|nr:hypothetical protein [Sphingomonas sp. AR_OL41]MDH7975668.1 hypothetical protein [Sphingomonas sp. AR_OL41]
MAKNSNAPGWFSRSLKAALVIGLCLISGVIGGAMNRNFGASSYTLSYADFISIMLTAISLLMTVLAIFLGVFGFIGWNSIEQKAHTKTEQFLISGFKDGGRLHKMLFERVEDALRLKTEEIMFEGISSIEEDDENLDGGSK